MKWTMPAMLIGLLAACGTLPSDQPGVSALTGLFAGLGQEEAAPFDPRRDLTRESVEAAETDFLIVAVVDRDAFATVQQAGTNGQFTTWLGADGIGLTYNNGVLTGSRGLGDDLIAADVSDVSQALRSGKATGTRIHDYLDGLDQIQRRTFQCDYRRLGQETITILEFTYSTQKIVESCVSQTSGFENLYWIDRSGVIWQSRQWVSDLVGYLDTQRL